MSQPAQIQPPATSPADALGELFAAQQAAILAQGVPAYAQWIADLDAVMRMVSGNQDRLLEAVNADFGNRSFAETRLGERVPIINGIKHIRSHLKDAAGDPADAWQLAGLRRISSDNHRP
ncbi:Aldehyde dehydrogenase [Pseudomonas syringae pv. cilantro]|uniref:Aldehyde dehydrogenase n=2 Tax=Pseudomonas syringae group TaxID=136849 RepID=A0A0N1JMH4_PSESX|nr:MULTISPECIES: hypothetical protein [Pseudomonas syringae group]KPC23568.1 Aldehyde dehydrogenase [Pseudomonas syringae pv. cilantro]KPW75722.1 Aldehyde dehydrogenase [Pseudomonas syringae pv. coriandricola]RMN12524.1 Aldehyde dehydrogenase [Pseudomonas syringae pv. coriandricola]